MRNVLRLRGVQLDVQIGERGAGFNLRPTEFHDWLTALHRELDVLVPTSSRSKQPASWKPLKPYSRCIFPKLRYVWLGGPKEERYYEEPLPVMVDLLDRMERAPLLTTLELAFYAPRTDYLPLIVDAITRGALDGLQRSTGRCTVGFSDWNGEVNADRRELEQACSERGIDLSELRWRPAPMQSSREKQQSSRAKESHDWW